MCDWIMKRICCISIQIPVINQLLFAVTAFQADTVSCRGISVFIKLYHFRLRYLHKKKNDSEEFLYEIYYLANRFVDDKKM